MKNFDSFWFDTPEEKQEAIEKAREILEGYNMHPDGIKHFLNNEEIVWTVCNDNGDIERWVNNPKVLPLSDPIGYRDLALVLTEMS